MLAVALLGGAFVSSGEPLLSYDWPLRVPSLNLATGGNFPFADAFDRVDMAPPSFFLSETGVPINVTMAPIVVHPAHHSSDAPDSSKDDVSELRKPMFDYVTGEIGVLYGRSTGRFARDFESGYITGTVGNEHMQISAGAAYENLSGGRGRFGR